MDEPECIKCNIRSKYICHNCINFYEKNITYNGGSSCINSIIRSGCSKFNIGRKKTRNSKHGCFEYMKIGWIDEIKYSKKIKAGRKKLGF